MADVPKDPMTALMEMATQIHELFLAFVAAGFTDQQALYLVGQWIRAAGNQQ